MRIYMLLMSDILVRYLSANKETRNMITFRCMTGANMSDCILVLDDINIVNTKN